MIREHLGQFDWGSVEIVDNTEQITAGDSVGLPLPAGCGKQVARGLGLVLFQQGAGHSQTSESLQPGVRSVGFELLKGCKLDCSLRPALLGGVPIGSGNGQGRCHTWIAGIQFPQCLVQSQILGQQLNRSREVGL